MHVNTSSAYRARNACGKLVSYRATSGWPHDWVVKELFSFYLVIALLLVIGTAAQTSKQRIRKKRTKHLPSTKQVKDEPSPFEFEVRPLEEWEQASASTDTIFYYNTIKMMRTPTGTIKTWIKGKPKDKVSEYPYTLKLNEFDCSGRKSRILSSVEYDENNRPSNHYDLDEKEAKWVNVAPGTVGEDISETVCKNASIIKPKQ
jgi:hypothetical protein